MSVLILVIFTTAIVYLFVGVEQLFRHKRKWYGRLIATFFLSLSLCLLVGSAYFSGAMMEFPWAHQIHIPFYFLLGPCCYLIFYYSDDRVKNFKKSSYLHFVIPVISLVVMMFYFTRPAVEKLEVLKNNTGMSLHWTEYVEQAAGFLLVFYLGWIYLHYTKHRVWTKNAIIFFGITASTSLIEVILMAVAFVMESRILFISTLTIQLLCITSIYIIARIYPDFFVRLALPEGSYRNSSLKNIDNDNLLSQMSQLLAQKPYLDPDITSTSFSQELGISERQLSEFLKNNYGENFRSLINRYRIDYVNSILEHDEKKNIIEIAFDAGFNSISVFNSVYKKYMRITPREYKKSRGK